MTPSVSVVVACHTDERWDTLVRSIESAAAQDPRPHSVIVAVDNNASLTRRLREAGLDIEVVENRGERGASSTRNAGAAVAATEYLAFLDDDSFAQPGWLRSLLEPFSDGRVVGTGGPVEPDWRVARPPWFPDEFAWVVGASYTGLPTVSAPIRNVWSVNMAVRRDVFAAVGGFRRDFGKVGRTSRPEDTDLCIRMSASTADGYWVYTPAALVRHEVPAERSTIRYFLRRSFWEGQGKVEMARYLGRDRGLSSEKSWLLRTVPAGIVRHLASAVRSRNGRDASQAAALIAGTAAAGVGAVIAVLRRGSAPRG
jgi:GT2 family glycosyltransferase